MEQEITQGETCDAFQCGVTESSWKAVAPEQGRRLTKIKVWAVVRLEEGPAGFGVDVCPFADQQLHIADAPPLDGDVKSSLT